MPLTNTSNFQITTPPVLWRYLKDIQMRSLGTWFNGGIDSVRLMVGLNHLEGLLQPEQFYDFTKTEHKDKHMYISLTRELLCNKRIFVKFL